MRVSDDAVRLAVIGKLGWIKRQRAQVRRDQPRQSQREMVSGESHYFLGRRYRLRVVEHEGPGRVVLRTRTHARTARARRNRCAAHASRVLQRWYRERLRELVPPLLAKWEAILGVQAADWGIKKMKTKWGTCNVEARRIWLNLELAKKPARCLEYIIVHELAAPDRTPPQRPLHPADGQASAALAAVSAAAELRPAGTRRLEF